MIVAELERALLARFPKTDAEPWDHVGLSVGDPNDEIRGVACALDATRDNVQRALEGGANVLLTHHPVYIKAPEAFCPPNATLPQCSAALYEAARCGVSIISLHTNLDRSYEARVRLSELLGAEPMSSLEHVDGPEACGLGALTTLDEPCSLRDLATRAATAFGSDPAVWGGGRASVPHHRHSGRLPRRLWRARHRRRRRCYRDGRGGLSRGARPCLARATGDLARPRPLRRAVR